MNWIRDWVWKVMSPFLTQVKNRLGNISISQDYLGVVSFMNPEGETTVLDNNVGEVVFETGKWSKVLQIQSKNYCSVFRLSVSHLHGSMVMAQTWDIIFTHDSKVDIVTVHGRTYGYYKIKLVTDRYGSGYVYLMPTSGSTETGRTLAIRVDNVLCNSFRIAPTTEPTDTMLVRYEGTGDDEGINTKIIDIVRKTKTSEGRININPDFALEELDYERYLNGTNRKLVQDNVFNGTNALQVTNSGGSLYGTVDMSVMIDKEYRATVYARGTLNGEASTEDHGATFYFGVISYDSDNLIIGPLQLSRYKGYTGFRLVEDLNVGDMSMKIEGDITQLSVSGTLHTHSWRFYKAHSDGTFRYTGANGRIYDDLAYSRWVFYRGDGTYEPDEVVDNGDGTITVNFKYPYETYYGYIAEPMKAGDAVINCYSGGSYSYWISNREVKLDTKFHKLESGWTEYTGYEDPSDYSGAPFRNGIAFARILLLPNYNFYKDGSKTYLGRVPDDDSVTVQFAKLSLEWRNKQ